MKWPAKLLHSLGKLRFKMLGLATIKDIPTKRFNELITELTADGWLKSYEYQGFDAWIDYGKVRLRKAGCNLKLEWDNWTEGSIEGPRKIIENLFKRIGLPVIYQWRWSEWDKNQ